MIVKRGGARTTLEPLGRASRLPHDLDSPHEFAIALERERARADRNGHGFSLVTFDVKNRSAAYQNLLKKVVLGRLRLTDEVGWFDGQRIGVLLFNTSREGALNYARSVCDAMMARGRAPQCAACTYPESWPEPVAKKEPSTVSEPKPEPPPESFKTDPWLRWMRTLDQILVRPDMDRLKNGGFWLDLKLLFSTIPAVFSRRGAH